MEKGSKFQWIKGDFAGQIESFGELRTEDDTDWLYFQSGKRINVALMGEFMIDLGIDVDMLESVPTQNRQQKASQTVHAVQLPKVQEKSNPLKDLILKQKRKESNEIIFSVSVDLPPQEIYSILKETYGDNIDEVILEIVKEEIKKKNIQEVIDTKITSFIKDKYNG